MVSTYQELNVKLSSKRWSCIIDPGLALSPQGLPVIKRLGEQLDSWIPNEIWRILDNTHFYLQQPAALAHSAKSGRHFEENPAFNKFEIKSVLHEWERLRFNTDLNRLKMFWIGDGVGESLLPEDIHTGIVYRYENLNRSLDARRCATQSALDTAYTDAITLCAALPSAFVLTSQPEAGEIPGICQVLHTLKIPYHELNANDALVILEREHLRNLLVLAGVARYCWAGLRLAVLHLVTPNAHCLPAMIDPELENHFEDDFFLDDHASLTPAESDYWQGAVAYWYALN